MSLLNSDVNFVDSICVENFVAHLDLYPRTEQIKYPGCRRRYVDNLKDSVQTFVANG